MNRVVVFGWLGLCACGRDDDKDPDGDTATSPVTDTSPAVTEPDAPHGLGFVAGTRLRPIGYATPDDPTVLVLLAWWDTQEALACRFARHADGSFRCLPTVVPGYSPFHFDPTCTEAGYQPVDQCEPIDRILEGGPRYGCRGFSLQVRAVVAESVRPDEVFYEPGCRSGKLSFDVDVYRDAGEIPAETYVEATLDVIDLPGEIDVRAYRATDGTIQVVGYATDAHGECSPSRAIDGEMRCLPSGTGVGFARGALLFADAECSDDLPFFFRATTDCDVPRYILDTTPDGTRIVESLGRYEESVYSTRGGACEAWETSDNEFALIRGEEIDPSAFPRTSEGQQPLEADPESPLRLALERSGDVVLRSTGLATDDGPCLPRRLASDPKRFFCLPESRVRSRYFSDAACTTPIGVVGEGSPVPSYFVETEGERSECGGLVSDAPVSRIFEAGAAWEGDLYTQFGEDCELDPVADGLDAYVLAQVDPSIFPEVRLVE